MLSKLRPVLGLFTKNAPRTLSVNQPMRNLTEMKLDAEKRRLVIQPDNQQAEEFPWVWLRDNCQCPLCYEKSSQQRIINLCEFDLNTKPMQIKEDNGMIKVNWDDGHVGEYQMDWLIQRSFRPEKRAQYQKGISQQIELWGNEMQAKYPTSDFNDVLNSDEALLEWLENMTKHGMVIMQNVPAQRGSVAKMQERIAYERMTHYGPGYDVEVKDDPSNIAYTPHRIYLHTDLVYYDYQPGVAFLHCIKQHEGKGGETMLADGFNAAQLLKKESPDMYRIMSETVGNFADIGTDFIKFDKIVQHPFFIHDARGDLVRVNWSHFGRHSSFNIDIDKVEDTYKAMRRFDDLVNDEANHIKLKMKAGDMACLHNQRVLHGRTELTGEISRRHLACGYVDWDEIRSMKRVLKKKLGKLKQ